MKRVNLKHKIIGFIYNVYPQEIILKERKKKVAKLRKKRREHRKKIDKMKAIEYKQNNCDHDWREVQFREVHFHECYWYLCRTCLKCEKHEKFFLG